MRMDYTAFTAEGDITDPLRPDAKTFEISLTVVINALHGRGSCNTEVYFLRTLSHFEAVDWVEGLNSARQLKI
jgi:hypothetical protein